MQKHKYNVLPEMSAERYAELLDDLRKFGYDETQPIVIYEGAILDGWNRYKACKELGIKPCTKEFEGDMTGAVGCVRRASIRRDLTSLQRACLAIEIEDFVNEIKTQVETERRKKQAETLKQTLEKKKTEFVTIELSQTPETQNNTEEIKELTYEYDQPLPKSNRSVVAAKLAQDYNTNRSYVQQAQQIKKASPETFEKVKSGAMSIPQAKKEVAPMIVSKIETKVPAPVNATTDDFTKLAAQYAQSFQKLLIDFERLNNSAWTEFKNKGQNFRHFGEKLDLFGGDHLPQKMIDLKTEAELLKGLKICPKCKDKKCGRCKNTGYLLNQDYKDAKSEMEIN